MGVGRISDVITVLHGRITGVFIQRLGQFINKYFKVIFRPLKGIIPIVLLANLIFMCKLEFKLILWIRLYRMFFLIIIETSCCDVPSPFGFASAP